MGCEPLRKHDEIHGPSLITNMCAGASLVVQWLRLRAPNGGGAGSIPGQGTRSHMPQLSCMPQVRAHMSQLNSLHAATKTQRTQNKIN